MNSRSSDNDCFAFLLRFARSQFNRRLIAVSVASLITGGPVRIDHSKPEVHATLQSSVRFVAIIITASYSIGFGSLVL